MINSVNSYIRIPELEKYEYKQKSFIITFEKCPLINIIILKLTFYMIKNILFLIILKIL